MKQRARRARFPCALDHPLSATFQGWGEDHGPLGGATPGGSSFWTRKGSVYRGSLARSPFGSWSFAFIPAPFLCVRLAVGRFRPGSAKQDTRADDRRAKSGEASVRGSGPPRRPRRIAELHDLARPPGHRGGVVRPRVTSVARRDRSCYVLVAGAASGVTPFRPAS